MALTESRKRANDKWNKDNIKQVTLKFMRGSDADIIEQLEKQPSKLTYIRQLVRADIARQAQEDPEE